MKFTPKEDIRHAGAIYEADNTYDSTKHGLSDEEVLYFRENGWAEVEGQEPAPERDVTRRHVVTPDTHRHTHTGG